MSNERIIAQQSRGATGVISGLTATGAELNTLGGVTAGTVLASSAVVVDSNKDIGSFRNVTIAGTFTGGSASDITINTNKFTVAASSGNTLVAGTLSATGNFAIATNKFTVTAASGNTLVAGTLAVTSDVAVNTNKFTVTASSGNTVVAGTLGVTGVTTPTGGLAAAGGFTAKARLVHTGGTPPQLSSEGNDSTPSVTETYYAEVFVPCNVSVTGISTFNGSATGSGNIAVYLVDSTGAQVTGALNASTAISGTDAYQRVAFAAPVTVLGPATYFVVTQYNNTAPRFNTNWFGDFAAATVTCTTFGTLPTITPASTFTTALGPMASLY